MSTTLCTGLIKNTVTRYIHGGGGGGGGGAYVYGCFLNAFDLVDHFILFEKLVARNLSPVIICLFLAWHRDQRTCVKWNGTSFSVSNGVPHKEGDCLLFSLLSIVSLVLSSWELIVIKIQCSVWGCFFMQMILPC